VLPTVVTGAAAGALLGTWILPAVAVVIGAVLGLRFGHEAGVDVDNQGVQPVPAGAFAAWTRVEDLRTERRGRRLRVVAYLQGGGVALFPAPYDGPLCSRDPEFERKVFLLRSLWVNHRRQGIDSSHGEAGSDRA
jgi:hypothetical protein